MNNVPWLLIIVVGFSVISGIVGKINEQKELRAQQERMRKNKEAMDAHRDGGQTAAARPAPAAQAETDPRLALQKKRQEQLRELRRRQGLDVEPTTIRDRQAPSDTSILTGQRQTSPPRSTQSTGLDPREIAARQAQERRERERAQQQVARREQAEARTKREAQARAKLLERQREPQQQQSPKQTQQPELHPAQVHRAQPVAPIGASIGTPVGTAQSSSPADLVRQSLRSASPESRRAELARAVALMETLAPPMSVRDEQDMPWNRSLG